MKSIIKAVKIISAFGAMFGGYWYATGHPAGPIIVLFFIILFVAARLFG